MRLFLFLHECREIIAFFTVTVMLFVVVFFLDVKRLILVLNHARHKMYNSQQLKVDSLNQRVLNVAEHSTEVFLSLLA